MSQNDSLTVRRRSQGAMQIPGDLLERVKLPQNTPISWPNRSPSRPPPRTEEVLGAEQGLRADSVHVCRVETVLVDRFSAIFTDPGDTDKRVRFLLKNVAPADRSLLREGAVFYWITGTTRDSNGDVVTKSYIRFKRTPRVTADELDELDQMAADVIQAAGGVPIEYDDFA